MRTSGGLPGGGKRQPFHSRFRRELVVFVFASVVTLAAVAVGIGLLSSRIASEIARDDAQDAAVRMGRLLVAPLLPEYLDGSPTGREYLDRVVTNRLSDGSVAMLVVWAPDGRVVYASDSALIGRSFQPTAELITADERREIYSEVNRVPPDPVAARLNPHPDVEVYVPLDVEGHRLIMEAYTRAGSIAKHAAQVRARILPAALGALVLLQLVQLPVVVSLARRLTGRERERRELLARSLSASERERQSIAADLHDGPVQELAGVAYGLAALRGSVPEEQRPLVDRLGATLRRGIESLRRLMFDIYPPDLTRETLPDALHDLAAPLSESGTAVRVEIKDLPDEVTPEVAAVLYRTTKEALGNVQKHAGASMVTVSLEGTATDGLPGARLTVTDDGIGPRRHTGGREGHLGLRLVRDRVSQIGGTVSLRPASEGGTVLDVQVPLVRKD